MTTLCVIDTYIAPFWTQSVTTYNGTLDAIWPTIEQIWSDQESMYPNGCYCISVPQLGILVDTRTCIYNRHRHIPELEMVLDTRRNGQVPFNHSRTPTYVVPFITYYGPRKPFELDPTESDEHRIERMRFLIAANS